MTKINVTFLVDVMELDKLSWKFFLIKQAKYNDPWNMEDSEEAWELAAGLVGNVIYQTHIIHLTPFCKPPLLLLDVWMYVEPSFPLQS